MKVLSPVVLDWMHKYRCHVREIYGIDVRYDYQLFGAAVRFDNVGKPVVLKLNGTFMEDDVVVRGVSMDYFADLVWCGNHEERHIMQYEKYRTDRNLSDDWKRMAEHFVVGRLLPEFYRAAYDRDPAEIDAEMYAITETRKYFKENYPKYNVDNFILKQINSINPDGRFFHGKFKNVDDVIDCYRTRVADKNAKPIKDLFKIELPGGPSDVMRKLRQDKDLCNTLNDCSTLREQCKHLVVFLRRERPGYFVQFPFMREVEAPNLVRKPVKSGFLDAVKNDGSGYQSPKTDEYDGLSKY